MSVADCELIYQGARLIGINDDNFACRQSAGKDPYTAGSGIRFMKLLSLKIELIHY